MYSIILNILSFVIIYILSVIVIFNILAHTSIKYINKCKAKIKETDIKYGYMLAGFNNVNDSVKQRVNTYNIFKAIKPNVNTVIASSKIFIVFYHESIKRIYNETEADRNLNYVNDCLINEIPFGINKTSENRFKLIYPHEKINTLDLYIIIEIDDFEQVSIITVYSFDKRRREREKER